MTLTASAVALLAACGGGGGDTVTNPLAKYAGSYSYCDQDHTKYSVSLTDAGSNTLNAAPTETTYQNSNCSGSVLGTYSWTAPAKLTFTSNSVATVRGGSLPASLTIDKVQTTLTNSSIIVSGPAASGNCITYPKGTICYDPLNINETGQVGLYLSAGELYELFLDNGVYEVSGVYTKN